MTDNQQVLAPNTMLYTVGDSLALSYFFPLERESLF